ncbi:hypothetical protein [Flavobacterium pedocola]
MKKTAIVFDGFRDIELSNSQKKSIRGGWGPNGPKPGDLPLEGEPVGTNNNGDGTRNDDIPIDPNDPTIPNLPL